MKIKNLFLISIYSLLFGCGGGGGGGVGGEATNTVSGHYATTVQKVYGDSAFAIIKTASCLSGTPTYSVGGTGLTLGSDNLTATITGAGEATVIATCPVVIGTYSSATASYIVKIAKKAVTLIFQDNRTSISIKINESISNPAEITNGLVNGDTTAKACPNISYNKSCPEESTTCSNSEVNDVADVSANGIATGRNVGTVSISAYCEAANYTLGTVNPKYTLNVTN